MDNQMCKNWNEVGDCDENCAIAWSKCSHPSEEDFGQPHSLFSHGYSSFGKLQASTTSELKTVPKSPK